MFSNSAGRSSSLDASYTSKHSSIIGWIVPSHVQDGPIRALCRSSLAYPFIKGPSPLDTTINRPSSCSSGRKASHTRRTPVAHTSMRSERGYPHSIPALLTTPYRLRLSQEDESRISLTHLAAEVTESSDVTSSWITSIRSTPSPTHVVMPLSFNSRRNLSAAPCPRFRLRLQRKTRVSSCSERTRSHNASPCPLLAPVTIMFFIA
mmetsp:Transcript_31595/g.64566  ORF Transcript_31595/g.64566 Transcript_31595/m.64566 type:complete len:206 (-) Transcript_31595:148-765(-)